MLSVVYESVTDLAPGRVVEILESRGRATVRIRRGATADEYLAPLNQELAQFVGRCQWFQIWRGKIISAASPDAPLTVQYVADDEVSRAMCVQIREDRGVVRLHVHPGVPSEQLVRALNPAIKLFLAGGQWFQLWQGEIVTMDSPDSRAA